MMNRKSRKHLIAFSLLGLLIFAIPNTSYAIAPILVPVFASILEIISGIILFLSAPAVIMAALISFFGLRFHKNKKGKISVHFNWKVFLLNTSTLFIYIIIVTLATFFLLKYKFNMVFVVAQKIQPKTINDLINGVEEVELKKIALSELLSAFSIILIFTSVILSTFAELCRMMIYKGKMYFNQKIFFQDVVWISIFTAIIMVLTTICIYYFFDPFFI